MLVVNPNLCFDRTLWVDAFEAGTVSRPSRVAVTAGGKGVNVSRTLRDLAVPSRLVGLLPDVDGAELERLLAEEGVTLLPVPVAGSVRVATIIVEASGRATVLNEPGPVVGPTEQRALLDTLDAALDGTVRPLVACSGSLPPGLPTDTYGRVAELVHAHGGTVVVDAARDALAAALPFGPDVVTPNLAEAQGVLEGRSVELSHQDADVEAERAAALRAAHGLRERGAVRAVVTVGSHGVAWVDADGGEHWTDAHDVRQVNPIGAGDSFVGGLLSGLADEAGWAHAVRHAAAVAGAAVENPVAGYVDADRVAELLGGTGALR